MVDPSQMRFKSVRSVLASGPSASETKEKRIHLSNFLSKVERRGCNRTLRRIPYSPWTNKEFSRWQATWSKNGTIAVLFDFRGWTEGANDECCPQDLTQTHDIWVVIKFRKHRNASNDVKPPAETDAEKVAMC